MSIVEPEKVKLLLGIPVGMSLVAYLCLGYVDYFRDMPELETLRWEKRLPLDAVLHHERFDPGREAACDRMSESACTTSLTRVEKPGAPDRKCSNLRFRVARNRRDFMNVVHRLRAAVCLFAVAGFPLVSIFVAAQTEAPTTLPSEIPAHFKPVTSSWNYIRRDVMIPMRDRVKLHTVILISKDAKGAPILLTRTPYDATAMASFAASSHLGPILQGYDNATDVVVEDGYIRVIQDIRGKYGSEGDYVMNRPLHGPLNPTPVDESTDTYDTIDWLVKNIPESNGEVGILGISYDGFLPLMALVNPHPALKVAVPMNPMVDGWMETTGSTTAPSVNRTWRTSMNRRRRARTLRNGGQAPLTITISSCRQDQPASSAAVMVLSRLDSGARSSPTPATTLSGAARLWIRFWRGSL